MRFMILFSCCVLPMWSFGQYEYGFLSEFFFNRVPSARAEAMGKGYAPADGDLGSIYFNPAGTATIGRLAINTSYTPPGYYVLTGSYHTFFATGSRLNRYFTIALSQYKFDFGKTAIANAVKKPFTERNTLTIASEPVRNLLVGVNANYFVWQPGSVEKKSTAVYIDAGIIKKMIFVQGQKNRHSLSAAASISNINKAHTNATFSGVSSRYYLPVIARYGLSYQWAYGKMFFIDTASIFKLLLQAEYQQVVNSKYRSGIRLGAELTLLNLLALRAGWYNEKIYDNGFPELTKSLLKEFTYGAGLHIPLYALAKIPVAVTVDYTSLPQANYSRVNPAFPRFTTYTLGATIFFNNKRDAYHSR
jgi:hypothetical protein